MIGDFFKMLDAWGTTIPEDSILFDAWRQEFIEQGMRDYF
jgi:hypothetical protein